MEFHDNNLERAMCKISFWKIMPMIFIYPMLLILQEDNVDMQIKL